MSYLLPGNEKYPNGQSKGVEFLFFKYFIRRIYLIFPTLKTATHLAILHADRHDRRKSPGVPGGAIAIFDRCIKSPISGMSDIGD